jgi:hypothetical protein
MVLGTVVWPAAAVVADGIGRRYWQQVVAAVGAAAVLVSMAVVGRGGVGGGA